MADAPRGLAVTAEEWRIVRDALRRHAPDREVWAFGSRAGGAPGRFSDLDLVLLGEEPLPLAQAADLREAFSDSDLPWRVDLLDWADISPSMRRRIEERRIAIV